jgi:hypothetical protein
MQSKTVTKSLYNYEVSSPITLLANYKNCNTKKLSVFMQNSTLHDILGLPLSCFSTVLSSLLIEDTHMPKFRRQPNISQ